MSIIKKIFKGVKKDWKEILLHDEIIDELHLILEQLVDIKDEITPNIEDIFTFAKFPLNDLKVVILSLDPYPTSGQAHGIAFSTLDDEKCPVSLRNIFKVLIKDKLIEEVPESFNLIPWSNQGILLLNTALTTLIGKSNMHTKLWKIYMDFVIKHIAKYHKKNELIWCLWGNEAQSKQNLIEKYSKKNQVLKYVHPSVYGSQSFKECDHFTIIHEKYPDIKWDLKPVETVWSTDGSCTNNGNKKANATWGAYCVDGPFKGKSFGSKLKSVNIAFKGKIIKSAMTNIRAEGLALINVMRMIRDNNIIGTHKIYTDSKFWIEMITDYIPKWIQKKIPWSDHQNSDLTEEFWNLSNIVNSKYGTLEFIFVRCWHSYKQPKEDSEIVDGRSLFAWKINKKAEEAAQKYL